MRLTQLSVQSLDFPSPDTALADPNGLLAFGGDLQPARLQRAYQQGIFPWYSSGEPILWWSPDPRAVLWPEDFHCSRSLARFHKNSPYRVTMNQAFDQVIIACASEHQAKGTWISPEIIHAYQHLHQSGDAHSIEVWLGEELVGGIYGVSQGALFCGESMFSRQLNTSKTALLIFCEAFSQAGGKLIDCQVLNDHTASLGAINIPRQQYMNHLNHLRMQSLSASFWSSRVLFMPAG